MGLQWDYSDGVGLEEPQGHHGTERNTGTSAARQVWDRAPLLAVFAVKLHLSSSWKLKKQGGLAWF